MMEIFKLAILFTLYLTMTGFVSAKSEPVAVQEAKTRFAQQLNSVSSTLKPETIVQYQDVQQYPTQPQKPVFQSPLHSIAHHLQQVQSIPQQLPQQSQLQHQLQLSQQLQMQHQLQLPQHIAIPQQYHQVPQQLQLHPQTQQQILQLIQKALYTSQQHHQPTAMIIIAQPALLQPVQPTHYNSQVQPTTAYSNQVQHAAYNGQVQQAAYSSPVQQMLNYFHNNPHARYQFLHSSPQPNNQLVQQLTPQPTAAQAANYQIYASPVAYRPALPQPTTHMQQVVQSQPLETYSEQKSTEKPHELNQINKLAQLAAQKFFSSQYQAESRQEQGQNEAQYKSVPPIITGLENFSPEQQVKIKAQLNAHFGTNIQSVALNKEGQNLQNIDNEFKPSALIKSSSESTLKATY